MSSVWPVKEEHKSGQPAAFGTVAQLSNRPITGFPASSGLARAKPAHLLADVWRVVEWGWCRKDEGPTVCRHCCVFFYLLFTLIL